MSITLASVTTQADAAKNDTRLDDFETFVKDQGKAWAAGDDAMPAFAVGFIRAVYDSVIDVNKDANGDDAAARYFKKLCAVKGKKAFHDRTEQSIKSQGSKVRQLQKAASNPKWDFVDVNNRGITIRQQAIKDGIEVKSPFPAMVDLAREQLKYDDELDDAMIFAVVTKTEVTKEVTLEGQLKKAAKILEDIITGEKYPGVHDNSPEVHVASEQLTARLNDIVSLRVKEEALAKASDLGFVQNEDGTWSMPA